MERMGTEYQIFNGKEYVSLRRFWNMGGKYKTEKAKNEELEEENKNLKIEIGGVMGERDGLKMVVERLHKELDECECSFGFESDEVGFWKREYKRLKKRIKDHCKGYGNLFPEDEMKRQWKKADKKRK